jgi:hypothetical protein
MQTNLGRVLNADEKNIKTDKILRVWACGFDSATAG